MTGDVWRPPEIPVEWITADGRRLTIPEMTTLHLTYSSDRMRRMSGWRRHLREAVREELRKRCRLGHDDCELLPEASRLCREDQLQQAWAKKKGMTLFFILNIHRVPERTPSFVGSYKTRDGALARAAWYFEDADVEGPPDFYFSVWERNAR